MIKLRQKGGVYGIVTVPVKKVDRITYTPKYPDNTIITAGHSENIKKRFSGYNKDKVDVEDRVENNLSFILHSPSQALNGTRILESLFFYHFKEFRISKRQEIFKFQKDFNLEDHFTELCEFFQIRNINNLAIYKCLSDVPYTVLPSATQVSDNEQGEFTLSPRNDFQRDVIECGLTFYKTEEKGGLYLPPGSGKTFITVLMTLEIPKKKNKPFLILCPRLAICSEWEKCISQTDCSFIIYNSESSTELSSGVRYIITTYQSYLKDIQKFHSLNFSMIIYDEAHHVMSGKEYSKSLDIPTLKKLFLTATPTIHRFDEDQDNVITESLDEATYGKPISQLSLHDAIDRGMLCGYRLLIHNKPSQTDCREHIRDLVEKFGRKKIVVFYNRRDDAKEAVELLSEVMENIFYIDGDTSKEDREGVFKSFEECDTGVLVNINVLSEGVSIPCIDCILMMDKRNSEKALIQIMGRALRLYPGKHCAILCIPVDCSDTLETALNALVYDGGSDNRVKGNLIVDSENKEISLGIVDDLEKRLKIIEVGRSGVDISEYKVKLLNDYFLREGKLCKKFYTYSGIKIGRFQEKLILEPLRKGKGYKYHIKIWCEKYPELFKELVSRVDNIKENPRNYTSPDRKVQLLNEYFIANNTLCKGSYIQENIRLGLFQNITLMNSIRKNKGFNGKISTWSTQYPELFRMLRNRVEKNKENPKDDIFRYFEFNKSWQDSDLIKKWGESKIVYSVAFNVLPIFQYGQQREFEYPNGQRIPGGSLSADKLNSSTVLVTPCMRYTFDKPKSIKNSILEVERFFQLKMTKSYMDIVECINDKSRLPDHANFTPRLSFTDYLSKETVNGFFYVVIIFL